ncbi:YczE/YyaS/YitT family protein [Amphibacillus sp. Q70]|uniref:YczE/YyaS/YitT family protein n=1 Tax=Amphibacillus sp. Q70 TaxID=3453416 RepID=UPI003F83FE0A
MNQLRLRILMMILGNLLLGTSIGIFIIGDLGTDPFATMNIGISSTLGLSFGVYQLLFNIALFFIVLFYGRDLIGFGTLINMTIVGFTADFVLYIYDFFAVGQLSMIIRILLLLVGILAAGSGLSLYISARLGVAPYDGLPLMIIKLTKERISFSKARVLVDATAVVIGFFFGAVVGIGTLVITLAIGPLVQFLNTNFSEPVIQRYDVTNRELEEMN